MIAVIEYPRIDPIAFELGPIPIRWYGIAYILGIVLGMWLLRRLAATRRFAFTAQDASDFILWAVLGIFIGGRLGSVLFYNFEAMMAEPLKIFAVWEGGMAFHGGLLGVVLAVLIFVWRRRLSLLGFGDALVCCVPIGLFFGRIANFINGELYGRPSSVPWAMVFPRAPDPQPTPRHPSQLYEAALEGIALFALLWLVRVTVARRCGRGLLGGVFLTGYALARMFIELFREPDAHIGFQIAGTTRGQLLSIPMLLIGLWLIVRALRRPPEALDPPVAPQG